MKTVAVDAFRNVDDGIEAEGCQSFLKHGGGGYSVAIEVAVDGHLLALLSS